jgi:anti-sigma factor RsiW
MSDMTCREGVGRLMDYLEGVVGVREKRAIDRHVSGCPRCRGFVASYVETPRLLRAALGAPLPVRAQRALRRRLAGLGRRR